MLRKWSMFVFVAAALAASYAPAQFRFSQSPESFREIENEESEEELETDRDSFTPAVSTVGKRRLLVESAYSFVDNRNVFDTHSLPEVVMRYGLTERFELRFGTNYEIGGAGNPISANVPDEFEEEPKLEEETNISYGFKMALFEQERWRPQSSFMVNAFTPIAGEATETQFAATYIAGWRLQNKWEFDNAMRYSTGSFEEDHFHIWAPSTTLKFPIGERWKAHVEYFALFSDGREEETAQHFFSTGAHYLLTNNFEVGSRFGWGLNDQAPDFFINIGCGVRF